MICCSGWGSDRVRHPPGLRLGQLTGQGKGLARALPGPTECRLCADCVPGQQAQCDA